MDTETDRTQRSLRQLLGLPQQREPIRFPRSRVAVSLSRELAATRPGQWMATLTFNLLFRLKEVQEIAVEVPSGVGVVRGVPMETGELRERLIGLAEGLSGPETPYRPRFEHSLARGARYDVLLAIGQPPYHVSADRVLSITANDWTGFVNATTEGREATDASLPFGSYAAACLGVGEVFKHLLSSNYPAQLGTRVRFLDEGCLSLLDYSTSPGAIQTNDIPEAIDIGDVLLVGCGAGGTACLYTLASIPGVSGTLVLVEPNLLKPSNLNRYPMTTYAAVHGRGHKLTLAAEFLRTYAPGLMLHEHPVSYQQFMAEGGDPLSRDTNSVVVSTVDNVAARRALQADFQEQAILDAAVTGTIYATLKVSYGHGRCLGCKHPLVPDEFEREVAAKWGLALDEVKRLRAEGGVVTEDHVRGLAHIQQRPVADFEPFVDREFNGVVSETECGESALGYTLETPAQVATLPFLTTLPGVILAAEIVKHRHFADMALYNWFEHDFMNVPKASLHRFKPPVADCSVGCSPKL